MHIARVELHVFQVRVRTLHIRMQLRPPFSDCAVAVEDDELRRVPVNSGDGINICVANAIEQSVESGENIFRRRLSASGALALRGLARWLRFRLRRAGLFVCGRRRVRCLRRSR